MDDGFAMYVPPSLASCFAVSKEGKDLKYVKKYFALSVDMFNVISEYCCNFFKYLCFNLSSRTKVLLVH